MLHREEKMQCAIYLLVWTKPICYWCNTKISNTGQCTQIWAHIKRGGGGKKQKPTNKSLEKFTAHAKSIGVKFVGPEGELWSIPYCNMKDTEEETNQAAKQQTRAVWPRGRMHSLSAYASRVITENGQGFWGLLCNTAAMPVLSPALHYAEAQPLKGHRNAAVAQIVPYSKRYTTCLLCIIIQSQQGQTNINLWVNYPGQCNIKWHIKFT